MKQQQQQGSIHSPNRVIPEAFFFPPLPPPSLFRPDTNLSINRDNFPQREIAQLFPAKHGPRRSEQMLSAGPSLAPQAKLEHEFMECEYSEVSFLLLLQGYRQRGSDLIKGTIKAALSVQHIPSKQSGESFASSSFRETTGQGPCCETYLFMYWRQVLSFLISAAPASLPAIFLPCKFRCVEKQSMSVYRVDQRMMPHIRLAYLCRAKSTESHHGHHVILCWTICSIVLHLSIFAVGGRFVDFGPRVPCPWVVCGAVVVVSPTVSSLRPG